MRRRTFLKSATLHSAGAIAAGSVVRSVASAQDAGSAFAASPSGAQTPANASARWRHSVCRWCYSGVSLDELIKQSKAIGISSIELLDEPEWLQVRAAGLECAVANGPTSITRGFNRTEHHDEIIAGSERLLPRVAAAGIPQMIVFSGNRAGLSDADGLRHCTAGLKRLMPLAESAGVTIIMELLNSKVDHKDYQCDHTAWGAELVQRVGSDRFRLLYDIYHMQIMEGDVIRTMEQHHAAISHYHTGGVPGRREIDGSQELHYPAIVRALTATGFSGYFAQEFIPSRAPFESLAQAVRICSV
ncbi:MAG: TIM barrel protein [Planctomycetes bacterium]|nr:TIM barrel protein [Planctomycetota bacterium]